jgi:hypothetical protein
LVRTEILGFGKETRADFSNEILKRNVLTNLERIVKYDDTRKIYCSNRCRICGFKTGAHVE